MKSFINNALRFGLTLAIALAVGGSFDVFGQKGKGNGHGNGGGRGGGQPRAGGMPPGQEKKMDFGGRQAQPQNRGWEQRQQRQIWRADQDRGWQQPQRQVWRQQENRDWRQPQEQSWRQQRNRGWERPRQQIWRQQAPQVYAPWGGRSGEWKNKDKGNGRWKGNRGDEGRFYGGWIPPGQIRRQQVHERNAIRKALKAEEKAYRRATRFEQVFPYIMPQPRYPYRDNQRYSAPYYYDNYEPYRDRVYFEPYQYRSGGIVLNSPIYVARTYGYDPYAYSTYGSPYASNYDLYGYDDGFNWKSMLVRTLIGFVLGNDGNGLGYREQYPYYAGIPGAYPYGSPAAYYGGYPTYSSYDPGFGYAQYYPLDPYTRAGYGNGLISMLPIGELLGGGTGYGYGSNILNQVLAQGYEQGYSAGWYARDDRLREEYLESLYRRDDDYYDPYSVSIGENRRIFSEGYALGYQDALAGRRDFVPGFAGNADLFSLLMSNVIGNV